MTRSGNGSGSPRSLLTLRQAARLTGLRCRALRERVHRGQVAVRVVGTGRKAKLRLTPDALAAAGLLPDHPHEEPPSSPPAGNADLLAPDLLALVREQNARIAALEEQRFQLAGQLGAALERAHALEGRVQALTAAAPSPSLIAGAAIGFEGDAPVVEQPFEATPQPSTRAAPPRARSSRNAPGGALDRGEPDPNQPGRTKPSRRSGWPLRVVAVVRRRAVSVAAARHPFSSSSPIPPTPHPNRRSEAETRRSPGPESGNGGVP